MNPKVGFQNNRSRDFRRKIMSCSQIDFSNFVLAAGVHLNWLSVLPKAPAATLSARITCKIQIEGKQADLFIIPGGAEAHSPGIYLWMIDSRFRGNDELSMQAFP